MHGLLLPAAAALGAIGALAFPVAPAEAQEFGAHSGFVADPDIRSGRFVAPPSFGEFGRDRRDHRRRHRDRLDGAVVVGGFGWNEGWALYNNRTFKSDSYNDWWHDRPDRAYPRWVHSNQNCDRLWWGGGAWRCGW